MPWSRFLFGLAFVAFSLKCVLQVASAFPDVAELAYKVRNFVIGYLHLVLIGFVSLFLLGIFIQLGWLLVKHIFTKIGLVLFLTGSFLSEALIFGHGTSYWWGLGAIPGFDAWLFGVSCCMPLGLLLLIGSQFRK